MMMAEGEDAAQAAARLEAALDRIANLTQGRPEPQAASVAHDAAGHNNPPGGEDVPVAELAARLDAVIAQLRRLLAR
jgi:broad specificity phosphatase PhoE